MFVDALLAHLSCHSKSCSSEINPPQHTANICLSCCLLIRACHAEHLDVPHSKATKQLPDLCNSTHRGGCMRLHHIYVYIYIYVIIRILLYFIIHQLNWATGKKIGDFISILSIMRCVVCPNNILTGLQFATLIWSSFSSAKTYCWTVGPT